MADTEFKTCTACRGYSLEQQWCGMCKARKTVYKASKALAKADLKSLSDFANSPLGQQKTVYLRDFDK